MAASVKESLSIQGMSCGGCVRHVEMALRKIAGVSAVSVDLAAGKATVEFDPSQTTRQTLAKNVTAAGYPAS